MTAFILGAGGYLLLAGSMSKTELMTALVVGALTSLWTFRVRRYTYSRFAPFPELISLLSTTPRLLLKGVAQTAPVMWRAMLWGGAPGKALTVDFQHGALDSPAERARRATTLLVASLAPDSFVVRLDRGRAALLHTIVTSSPGRDPRRLP